MKEQTLSGTHALGGTFTFPGTGRTVHRMGYGAMQLAGPHVFGPPRDPAAARAVLRAALEAGIDHIDTSDFYGPHVTNQLIREALHPYPAQLVIVTKVGARRDGKANWLRADEPAEIEAAIHDNLRNLGLDTITIVNYRAPGMDRPEPGSIARQIATLADLKRRGLIRHIGVSNVTPEQFAEAESLTPIVCVQNNYNIAHRADDAFIDRLAAKGIAYVPYFPLGGFSPLQSQTLSDGAAALGVTPFQLALAWLLRRAPNILLIPGTSSLSHLKENIAAAEIDIPEHVTQQLATLG